MLEREIQNGGFRKKRFRRLSTQNCCILLTLLSLALVELLLSFPFSLFLLLDLDLVMLCQVFDQNRADSRTAILNRKWFIFPQCLDEKRAKLDSESTNGRRGTGM